jgi:hypothetical protein
MCCAPTAYRAPRDRYASEAISPHLAGVPLVELRGFEPRTEPGEMALELRFLSFGVVTRVLRFLRICVGVLRDVTVLDRLVWRPTARG